MRARARSFEAQAPFSGVRTILIPPDIVAVPRRSPVPVRKRTPWHPQPDGQVVTERSGAREWFSDRLFVEGADDHKRSGYGVAAILHACAAAVVVAGLVSRPTPAAVFHARTSLMMPAVMSVVPRADVAPAPARAGGRTRSQAPRLSAHEPETPSAAAPAPAPIEAPADVAPESAVGAGSDHNAVGTSGELGTGGPDAVDSGSGGSGSDVHGPYRVGGDGGVRPPRKIKDVKPMFPQRALSERARGTVIIEATIGEDGRVRQAVVVHSIATLDQAALDAVRQWEYAPSVINGVAVAVIMLVVVNFTIQ